MREIVLDTETTGLDPEAGHRIVEIGCVELVNHLQTGRHWRVYLNPERDMPEEAFRVHGLSSEFLADKPRFAEVVEEFLAFVGDAPLVIHNADFHLRFLATELTRSGRSPIDQWRIVDTVQLARRLFPAGSTSHHRLSEKLGLQRVEHESERVRELMFIASLYRRLLVMNEGPDREKREAQLLDAWEALSGSGGFVRDGILDHIAYNASPLRTVFLLKEANNEEGESYSLRHVVLSEDRWQTWNNLARWCAEILSLSGDSVVVDDGPLDVETRRILLRSFAFVNLKKTPGGPRAGKGAIRLYARTHRELILRQLEICDPELVICCGEDVWDIFVGEVLSPDERSRLNETRVNSEAWVGSWRGKTSVLSYWHPQATRTASFLQYNLKQALEILLFKGQVRFRKAAQNCKG